MMGTGYTDQEKHDNRPTRIGITRSRKDKCGNMHSNA